MRSLWDEMITPFEAQLLPYLIKNDDRVTIEKELSHQSNIYEPAKVQPR
jgi:hypothetical protein